MRERFCRAGEAGGGEGEGRVLTGRYHVTEALEPGKEQDDANSYPGRIVIGLKLVLGHKHVLACGDGGARV